MDKDVYIWVVIGCLLLGALLAEYKATTDMTNRVKKTLENIADPSITSCDIVGNATQLNEWSNNAIGIQWRRAMIASSFLWILLPYVNGLKYSSQQYFINLLLTWVVFSGISGYFDYHVRTQASNGIDSCLVRGIEKLSSNGDICSQVYINYVT